MARQFAAIFWLIAICPVAVAKEPAATQPVANWGPAVEGVRAGLRVEKIVFERRETPQFEAAIRNDGILDLFVARTQMLCEIELDGKWHRWIGDVDAKSSPLGPGQAYDGIAISLVASWSPIEDGGRLKLEPGKHLLRVAFFPASLQRTVGQIKAVSNVVAFELAR